MESTRAKCEVKVSPYNRTKFRELIEMIFDLYDTDIKKNELGELNSFDAVKTIKGIIIVQCHYINYTDGTLELKYSEDSLYYIDEEKTLDNIQYYLDDYFNEPNKILTNGEDNEFMSYVLDLINPYFKDFYNCEFIVFYD